MQKKIINSVDDFFALCGRDLGSSRWIEISQELIDSFADATFDHQLIHTNPERARNQSPFKTTVAHGYFTLSLLPTLLEDILEVNNLDHLVNYSIRNMVYKNAVPSGSRIRLVATLCYAKDLGKICKTEIKCCFEIEGQDIPALEGSVVYLFYFK